MKWGKEQIINLRKNGNFMKKILILFIVVFAAINSVSAQRYAIIDTKYILDKMPEYKDAQKQLDDIAAGWQKEILQFFYTRQFRNHRT